MVIVRYGAVWNGYSEVWCSVVWNGYSEVWCGVELL